MTDDRLDGTILVVLDAHGPVNATTLLERLARDHGTSTTNTQLDDRLRTLEQRMSVKRERDGRWAVHRDFHAPRHRLLLKMLAEHSERDRIAKLQRELTVDGDRAWAVGYREDRAGDWIEWFLYPTRPDDERDPIVIGGLPLSEVARQERDQRARVTEHHAE
jgi:hypothetical protein